jgi:L-threonylcarbamoyladenylate synthase
MSALHIQIAAHTIAEGGVIAYPTEGVWGLGCDPWNVDAVFKILKLKNRPWQKGLILIASHVDQVKPFLSELTSAQTERVCASWPGPHTWVVPNQSLPQWLRGDHPSIALRVSNHPVVRELCDAVGGVIVSTSANLADKTPATTALKVKSYFGDKIDYIVPGELNGLSKPTTITDAVSGQQLR